MKMTDNQVVGMIAAYVGCIFVMFVLAMIYK
jgi:hypothetical protein